MLLKFLWTVLPSIYILLSSPLFQFSLFHIFKNGGYYIGEWKDSWKLGYGECYYSNGDVYKGNWVNDMKEGQGTMTYNGGTVESGLWKGGKFQG